MTQTALIVAHGQPSDPDAPEAEIAALAAEVGRHMPGWRLGGVTLAGQGTLEAAVSDLPDPLIFPFFMSDGWFTRTNLPNRLRQAGVPSPRVLTPFGMLPEANALALRMARQAAPDPAGTTLVLAAHGSGRSPYPAKAAQATADYIAARAGVRDIRVGFIEEEPHLVDCLKDTGPDAVCLPLFVARWGHVIGDIPEAVEGAGFTGRLLDPLGTHPDVPALIAGHILQNARAKTPQPG